LSGIGGRASRPVEVGSVVGERRVSGRHGWPPAARGAAGGRPTRPPPAPDARGTHGGRGMCTSSQASLKPKTRASPVVLTRGRAAALLQRSVRWASHGFEGQGPCLDSCVRWVGGLALAARPLRDRPRKLRQPRRAHERQRLAGKGRARARRPWCATRGMRGGRAGATCFAGRWAETQPAWGAPQALEEAPQRRGQQRQQCCVRSGVRSHDLAAIGYHNADGLCVTSTRA
jgi:hypothetical protein